MNKFNLLDSKKRVHFIGIGGISMSGLAELLNYYGCTISGSDSKESDITERLKSLGIKVYYGHSAENINNHDLVVYTDAISLDNDELKEAITRKIDIIDRASLLGALMNEFSNSIAVSGTHGKTTTTSMLSNITYHGEAEPTILLGGLLDEIGGNVKIGKKNLLLTEACEYRANILKYNPSIAVILNIDEDHLDYFDNIDHIVRTFKQYVDSLGPLSNVIYNADDPNTVSVMADAACNSISFGIENDADYVAKNISYNDLGLPSFDLYIDGEFITKIKLKVMGKHNVYNTLAAVAAARCAGINIDEIVTGVESYCGVHRRLEQKASINGVSVYDDYAHHPTEIMSSLHALKQRTKGRLICIFQPHTYTRTRILLDSFAHAFNEADEIIITDIYAAREKDYGDIHSRTLVDELKKQDVNAKYSSGFEEIVESLAENARENDIIVTMGAGDVYKIGDMLIKKLRD